jgi:cellulose synthase/poly-beta-1,6-N-acetylglucosamine synthase-like glycosyltransferase
MYIISTLWISLYGYNSWALAGLYLSSRKSQRQPKTPNELPNPLPKVTIQLPIYNEKYVVGRLLKAVTELDYPKELLQIQILDDPPTIRSKSLKRWLVYIKPRASIWCIFTAAIATDSRPVRWSMGFKPLRVNSLEFLTPILSLPAIGSNA